MYTPILLFIPSTTPIPSIHTHDTPLIQIEAVARTFHSPPQREGTKESGRKEVSWRVELVVAVAVVSGLVETESVASVVEVAAVETWFALPRTGIVAVAVAVETGLAAVVVAAAVLGTGLT